MVLVKSLEDMIEYKTTACFTPDKILKILVPDQLMPVARRVFAAENAEDKLQAVPHIFSDALHSNDA